jgi:DHA2 family multidrug resistance protein
VLNKRTDPHIVRLQARVTWGNALATDTINTLTQRFQDASDAAMMALKQFSFGTSTASWRDGLIGSSSP